MKKTVARRVGLAEGDLFLCLPEKDRECCPRWRGLLAETQCEAREMPQE